jgi:hypothetical protein
LTAIAYLYRWFILAAFIVLDVPLCFGEEFIPASEIIVCAPLATTDAENLAVRHFAKSLKQFTGIELGQCSSLPPRDKTALIIGNRESLTQLFGQTGWIAPTDVADEANQSYVLAVLPADKEAPRRLVAAGFGADEGSRSFLGLGYALGDLLRRLERRDGIWGFPLPSDPVVSAPSMPNRTLYLMNSSHMNPGLSLEFMSHEELQSYVDFLIDARYSRISFWQWASFYLYPGNEVSDPTNKLSAWPASMAQDFQSRRARNQRVHQTMRRLVDYSRRRGLEVYHQLSPMHANVDLLPNDPKFVATGYYGRTSICWAQPEGRELARRMAQAEMEYFGPVDGYIVWFYDPGGCFCATCYPNQADHLFQQFSMVEGLAGTISPEAEFQAVLWPTWCFHEYQDRGIPYKSVEEVNAFVSDFLGKLKKSHPPRALSIMDTCEQDNSNIYNGLVKAEDFRRTAFMYTVMGQPSEAAYPFTAFRINDLNKVMGKARDRKLDDAVFFIQYTETNMPSVFSFADALYEKETTPAETAMRYAAGVAKGQAQELFAKLLLDLDKLHVASSYDKKAEALDEVKQVGEQLQSHPLFFGSRDWLRGQIIAREHYLGMARAETESDFQRHFSALKHQLAEIPMYRDYVEHSFSTHLAGRHVQAFWRAPLNDSSRIGLPKPN